MQLPGQRRMGRGDRYFRPEADAAKAGYASVSTDTGHIGGSGSFALGHPEKLIDFSWRSEHEMTVKAKAIIQAFYGNAPRLSYWNGCSTGGRQGLKEAQKFPDDFDGIITGACESDGASRLVGRVRGLERSGQLHPRPVSILADPRGRADRVRHLGDLRQRRLIGDPTNCKFDPKVPLQERRRAVAPHRAARGRR